MAIRNTKFPASTEVNFGDSFAYRGAVQATGYRLDSSMAGAVGDNVDILNSRYDKIRTPSGLGPGITVDSTGSYLYSDEYGIDGEPIAQFTLLNVGENNIYAGINMDASGWSIGDGIIIESGASYTFGEPGTQVVRNVWAITKHVASAHSTSIAAGYAVNLDTWSV